ncbi:hypothetical protein N9B04_00740 [bacterium]|nr:hypothetical protein [bacterium]
MAANEMITHGTEQSGEPKWRLTRILPVENPQSPLGYLDHYALDFHVRMNSQASMFHGHCNG